MKSTVVPFFISHLGCPHRCVFCDQQKIAGAKGALPAAEEILAKVAEYRATSPGRGLEAAFFGGTFTALPTEDQRSLLEPLQPLLASGDLNSIRLSTRPDAIDPDMVRFLKTMGVQTVELGVQSMDDEVLTLSGRGHTAADVERATVLLQEAGVAVGIQLMPGLPEDSERRSLDSLQRVLTLNPSFLRIYPTLVISGTVLADLYLAGRYQPQTLDEAVSLCKRMLTAAMRASVPVIRLGLQPTAELESPGTLLAGPFHPAFGQLVESELCFDVMAALAAEVPRGSEVAFFAPSGRISDVVGQKRLNIVRLEAEFKVKVLAVKEDSVLGRTQIAMEWGGGRRSGDIRKLE